jgi:hypothetical protein
MLRANRPSHLVALHITLVAAGYVNGKAMISVSLHGQHSVPSGSVLGGHLGPARSSLVAGQARGADRWRSSRSASPAGDEGRRGKERGPKRRSSEQRAQIKLGCARRVGNRRGARRYGGLSRQPSQAFAIDRCIERWQLRNRTGP